MRILFVSGVAVGGSARSTGELADRLAHRGNEVGVVYRIDGAPTRRYVHKRATNLAVKLGNSAAGRAVAGTAATIGRRAREVGVGAAVRTWQTILPENSLAGIRRAFRPDVVVASSVSRPGWRRMRAELERDGVPSVLYLREQAALGHLAVSHAPPDLLLANAHTYAAAANQLGYEATMIPSVVTPESCRVESTRERVLFVNPVASYGLDRALSLAEARPDVAFAFVEWWRLSPDARTALRTRIALLPNVELRPPASGPRALYADARILLTPYTLDMRPRVVLEAQVNGIPVLATDLPALAETVGTGGVMVAPDAPFDAWARALADMIDDPVRYGELVAEARSHASRDEVHPDAIVERFEAALTQLVATRRAGRCR